MEACRLALVLLLAASLAKAQDADSVNAGEVNHKRLRTVVASGVIGYGITLAGLSELWYKDSRRQSFQFFNDNAEWKQVDKMGHFYSSFYLSLGASKTFRWCGITERKSAILGAMTGFLLMVPIEILDGYSPDYGASAGDLMADAGGALLFLGQTLTWHAIRIHPKFSYHPTDFAELRPDVLGDNLPSRILKDYNGQTYWLSFDMDTFVRFPRWLNLALGYGATNMVYARDEANSDHGYQAYRQYYFSLDPDLTAIQTRSKVLRTALFIINMIKLPSPTLEFSNGKTTFHLLY